MLIPQVRYEVNQPFDYRPLLSFYVALAAQGLAFVGMGLFFSSMTDNQISERTSRSYTRMASVTRPRTVGVAESASSTSIRLLSACRRRRQ